jgi:hypothetical protein
MHQVALRDLQIPLDKKYMFDVTCPNAHFLDPQQAHLSLKNSTWTFRTLNALERTM